MKLTLIQAVSLSLAAVTASYAVADVPVGIVIHGGAGTIERSQMSNEQQKHYEATLAEAVNKGYELLAAGGSSLDAVTLAVTVLENSPLFNAGKGAVYTWDETHELDAAIMTGHDRNAGAVASVTTVKNPILLARAVMEKSDHVMLTGKGAEQFALAQQLEQVDNRYFNTEFRYEALKRAKQAQQPLPHQAAIVPDPNWKMGTVGAVAIDSKGNLAAATSTGGMTAKRWGRVGDVPVLGAGNFADNTSCAVSGTGHGEYFIRYNVASDICARVKYQGKNAALAAKEVIAELLQAGGTGGVIVVDAQGELSWAFNTPGMYRAKRDQAGTVIEIFADESEKAGN
ncbi:MAG: beta-aspartyl-peptidase [Rheinheimera sp.]|uniref:isoaspartyl peptidase/L-asparaginase family protein n=1 Tax=Arsukibacterium sp. UBA3155 TaxID=1946058 RepID=UPI000C97E744|nr:isoaspartyl peptidase/L-asparaginase [Arsukibacterium sp. UBA3155]MAD76933.1 beta-aspartyl-peptidase [Rheinheimera sp.]|tara:strand:- start:97914 stop:98939 length:1026 start_codon:yes stop_codon:yes gene_type:complete